MGEHQRQNAHAQRQRKEKFEPCHEAGKIRSRGGRVQLC
jgi:hypothetical protein